MSSHSAIPPLADERGVSHLHFAALRRSALETRTMVPLCTALRLRTVAESDVALGTALEVAGRRKLLMPYIVIPVSITNLDDAEVPAGVWRVPAPTACLLGCCFRVAVRVTARARSLCVPRGID